MASVEEIKSRRWFGGLVITLYLAAIVLANHLITVYGQSALPWVAFTLIPFDLVARDLMQDRWQPSKYEMRPNPIFLRMAGLILLGAAMSWITGTGSLRVNIASLIAFVVAGTIDALTYQWMIRYGRIFRINAATFTAAITDSIIFVTIAFNEIIWILVGLQIGMKIAGGFVWSLLLYRFFKNYRPITVIDSFTPYEASITVDGIRLGGIIQDTHKEWVSVHDAPQRGFSKRGHVVLAIGDEYESVKCVMCEDENSHTITGAEPSEPFTGVSTIDLECQRCGNLTYITVEGYCTAREFTISPSAASTGSLQDG